MKYTEIVSAFPATGKSWIFDNQKQIGITALDSDSSGFSWIEKGIRNPDFPNNYIQHIKENIGKVDFILVSSHDTVRSALRANNIHYTLIFPAISCKNEYIERFKNCGNNEQFIEFISNNWDNFISDMENEEFPNKIQLSEGQYLKSLFV